MWVKLTQQKKWCPSLALPRDEVTSGGGEIVVAGLHSFPSQRAGILDLLLSNPAPARLHGRVVLVGRVAVQHSAWSEPLLKLGILRIIGVFWVFFRIKVIKVAQEVVEAVGSRQILVLVAQVVLTELALSSRRGNVWRMCHKFLYGFPTIRRLRDDSHVRPAVNHRCQSLSPDRMLICDQHCIGLEERFVVFHLIIYGCFRSLHVDPPSTCGYCTQQL